MIEILSLYNKIHSDEKKQFESSVKTFKKKKGDFLLFDGDVQDSLFMIKKGVTFLYDDTGRDRRILDFFYNNRFCADFISFTNQSASKYCIECLSNCIIESISYDSLQKAFNQSKAIETAYRVLLEKMLIASILQNVNQRELSMEDRFKQIMHRKPELFKMIPHKYIASYVNIDVTNFSKLYNKHCVRNGLLYK
ncbi:cAMP-binding domain of CRP or a regulatory subunit of cAMP-dependent protein kinases [Cyclobacterium xiamenense]|uniref:cAMP-binding domain of CRP or a regulatory subunit of cAMP-dependent protein kinases n=1 Tax=Cyclobacterium xiamenense TaxID=1297121 RepID=A0A1H7AP62_9BACT|nr:cyclic nucleotide-binding domain-containing protein [Cyclobacterium xiamenense]SEJ67359.1 cAMP-binding domain of CRP or a regulatory subunit of cAMP-dependent protein kinases [Cyclobacterium xiamenense]